MTHCLVTSDQFTAGLDEVRTEIAALDTRLSTQIANLDLGGFVPDL